MRAQYISPPERSPALASAAHRAAAMLYFSRAPVFAHGMLFRLQPRWSFAGIREAGLA
ncbi:MAG: hypothetical protein ACRD2D_05700 [Terriglobales bacterium]